MGIAEQGMRTRCADTAPSCKCGALSNNLAGNRMECVMACTNVMYPLFVSLQRAGRYGQARLACKAWPAVVQPLNPKACLPCAIQHAVPQQHAYGQRTAAATEREEKQREPSSSKSPARRPQRQGQPWPSCHVTHDRFLPKSGAPKLGITARRCLGKVRWLSIGVGAHANRVDMLLKTCPGMAQVTQAKATVPAAAHKAARRKVAADVALGQKSNAAAEQTAAAAITTGSAAPLLARMPSTSCSVPQTRSRG